MRVNRFTIPALFLLLVPIAVAWFGLGPLAAATLVLIGVLSRWAMTLFGLTQSPRGPFLRLETISVSHYAEKVRWCLDRLGVPYAEEHNAGILGVFFLGRTVPRLHVRTGAVTSVIGNSPEILRYLWGRYTSDYRERAAFLEPTAEALALEQSFDEYGRDLQRWFYYHGLPDRSFTLHAWGRHDKQSPRWQRAVVIALFPVLRRFMSRAFQLSPQTKQRSVENIERVLSSVEERLADGRKTLLGGDALSFVDITFAALSGIWVNPSGYGGGRADAVIPSPEQIPPDMAAEMAAWRQNHPRAVELVERLYRDERARAVSDG